VFYGKGNARPRAACFVPKGTKHVSYGLRRAFGAIKRFHSVLWETSITYFRQNFATAFFILFFNTTIRNRFVACEHTGSQAMAHGAMEEAVQY
jgi:hypothetical protein